MAKMLIVFENYALNLKLHFSTDPGPKKSKSKTILMNWTRLCNTVKPMNLQLYRQDLPWVSSATHLISNANMGQVHRLQHLHQGKPLTLPTQNIYWMLCRYTAAISMAACYGICMGKRLPSSTDVWTPYASYAGIFPGAHLSTSWTIFFIVVTHPFASRLSHATSNYIAKQTVSTYQ